jgi:hypothetical protein
VRGGEDRQERAEEVEDPGEGHLGAEHDLVDRDRIAAVHLHFPAEQLRARERAVHDVEVDGEGEDDDEDGGEEEVGEQRPAGRGLAEHVFDVCDECFH